MAPCGGRALRRASLDLQLTNKPVAATFRGVHAKRRNFGRVGSPELWPGRFEGAFNVPGKVQQARVLLQDPDWGYPAPGYPLTHRRLGFDTSPSMAGRRRRASGLLVKVRGEILGTLVSAAESHATASLSAPWTSMAGRRARTLRVLVARGPHPCPAAPLPGRTLSRSPFRTRA